MPKQLCVFATRAAGILPLGFIGTVAEFPDLDGFHTRIPPVAAPRLYGRMVIHPSQVAILNEEFQPGPDEVAHAGRVLAAYDAALAAGVGAVTVDGEMIDVPVVVSPGSSSRAKPRSPPAKARCARPPPGRRNPQPRSAEVQTDLARQFIKVGPATRHQGLARSIRGEV